MIEILEDIIGTLSDSIWPIFLPCMLVVGAYTALNLIFKVKKQTTKKAKLKPKNIVGPASISLGAMIGTGAIIAVLGSLSKLVGYGQHYLEAMAIWGLIGALIMVPVSYSEVVASKIMGKTPKEYIGMLLSKKAALVYGIAFAALYVFGFSGFQFSGIDSVITIISEKYIHLNLSQIQRFCFIIIPLLLVVASIVLSRKHEVFINSMTYMIGSAVILYFVFFIVFIVKTNTYIPVFISKMISGMSNPITMMIGMPAGLILGLQRVLQTSETGLGSQAMAAQEADTEPREAGLISLIPCCITVFVSIVITSYIASYGIAHNIFSFPGDGIARLTGLFTTAESVCGIFGIVVLSCFTILSALTTLLGSYYYLGKLFNNDENTNIKIYLCVITIAGTLAVFGLNVVFDAVDLLLFVVASINITALAKFMTKDYKKYRLKKDDKETL